MFGITISSAYPGVIAATVTLALRQYLRCQKGESHFRAQNGVFDLFYIPHQFSQGLVSTNISHWSPVSPRPWAIGRGKTFWDFKQNLWENWYFMKIFQLFLSDSAAPCCINLNPSGRRFRCVEWESSIKFVSNLFIIPQSAKVGQKPQISVLT